MSYAKLVKNIGIMGFINILLVVKSLILLPILTKSLGAFNYGIFSQIAVSLGLSTPLVTLGLPYALIRFLSAKKSKKEIQEGIYSVALTVFLVCLTLDTLLLTFSHTITSVLKIPTPLLAVLAMIIVFEALNMVFFNSLVAFQKIKAYFLLMLMYILGEIGLTILALWQGLGVYGAVEALLAIRIIIFLSLFSFTIASYGIRFPQFSEVKHYLAFGLPATISNISYWVLTSSDRYLIGLFLGIIYVGYYSPAYAIGNLLNFFIFPFGLVLPAVLAQHFDNENINEVKKHLTFSLKYFLLIAMPAGTGLAMLSRQLLDIFATREISEHAYAITPFVVLGVLCYGIYFFFGQILYLKKRTKIDGAIWTTAVAINVGLNLIFIPRFGIIAAAISTLFSYILALAAAWWYTSKHFTFPIDWLAVAKSAGACLVMAAGIFLFPPSNLVETIFSVAAGAIIYGACIIMFKTLDIQEISALKRLFLKEKPGEKIEFKPPGA